MLHLQSVVWCIHLVSSHVTVDVVYSVLVMAGLTSIDRFLGSLWFLGSLYLWQPAFCCHIAVIFLKVNKSELRVEFLTSRITNSFSMS